MSKEGEMLIYAHSMLKNAFDKLYKKETNTIKIEDDTNAFGLSLGAHSVSSDTHRVISVSIAIPKEQ